MSGSELIGLFEVAELSGVTPSAVANWRKRFPDFPRPVAELKSGPVFNAANVRSWLRQRTMIESSVITSMYGQLADQRGDGDELKAKIEECVQRLRDQQTSTRRPGVLLGKIQSGKTRAFLGIIALAFDSGYDVAVILTKGTVSLARQTFSRVKSDFRDLIAADEVQVYDIMSLPDLTPYELNQKLILIVKKEDDNLDRLLAAFETTYPSLQNRRVLIIDDEADLASVSFRKARDGSVGVGLISGQIDKLRTMVADSDFLQVTATPYSLYLQPENEILRGGQPLFLPKRPAFTVILPTHNKYVGGDYYFEKSTDPDSPAYYFYREVPLAERDALKKEDGRRLQLGSVLTARNAAVLRDAIFTFLVAGAVRRVQQSASGERAQKYSFLFHTEQSRRSHEWQEKVATAIRDGLVREAREDSGLFNELLQRVYADLQRSVLLAGSPMPELKSVKAAVVDALVGGQLMITRVNSETEVGKLLDDDGQLKLRTPFNMFIGGQILDRGITISNLIGFYYGRNPKRFQQDTVLQHSRMYGARSMADLAVTRFYAPQHIYQIMRNIHEFDAALREAFESNAHDRGVYFIQKDASNRLVPCSPNKLAFSEVTSIRPGKRLLPVGFQTVYKSYGLKNLQKLDERIEQLAGSNPTDPLLITIADAVDLLELAYENLEFDEDGDNERKAHVAALEHLSKTCSDPERRNKAWLLIARDRNVKRYREEGRFSNAPDTKQQADLARSKAENVPVLMLLRQNGTEDQGWRGLPFWWPVIVTPQNAVTSIFAADEPADPNVSA